MPPKRGSVEIDAARCKACALCAYYCPKGCFSPSAEMNALGCRPFRFVDGSECTACGVCGWVCPDMAIQIFTERAAINAAVPPSQTSSMQVRS
jgi:2-oxoglutarate ferredoxin oxidoreductase subunit delta